MKKLLLLSAVLLGAATASQAGVRFDIGIPIPAPPVIIAPRAYVEPAPTYVEPAPTYVEPAPEICPPAPIVIVPPVIDLRFGHEPYWQHFRDQFRYRHYDRDDHYRHYRRDYDRDWHHDHDRGYHRRW